MEKHKQIVGLVVIKCGEKSYSLGRCHGSNTTLKLWGLGREVGRDIIELYGFCSWA